MKTFLLDLWNDLRVKRLWPVAVVLVAALVATPVVLSKKAEAPEVASAPQPAADAAEPEAEGPAELAKVKLAELAEGSGSSLSVFNDPDNPFAPPRKVLEAGKEEGPPTGGADIGAGSTGAAPSAGSDGGDVTSDLGGTGGDFGGDTGGDVVETPEDPGGDTGETTRSFTYVVDATFRQNGRTRRIKGMEKLDILPNETSPLLIFLGVDKSAGNAVFLVDSTLQAAGEGACKPSNSDCAFLYLGAGSEHEFTNEDGDSYTLRIDEIRRVELRKGQGRKGRAAKKGDRRPRADAALGSRKPSRRFVPPLLTDLVTVSSGAGADSDNQAQDR
jgi:hypothetical protein